MAETREAHVRFDCHCSKRAAVIALRAELCHTRYG